MVDADLNRAEIVIRLRPAVGQVPGRLDNPIGPAVVSGDREVYFLDGVRLQGIGEWQDILARRAANP
jgi:hypothetical protein